MLSSSKGQLLVRGVNWYLRRLPGFQRALCHRDLFTQVFSVMQDPVESKRVSLFHIVLNCSRDGHIAAGLCHQHCLRTWERSASTLGASGQLPSLCAWASGVPDPLTDHLFVHGIGVRVSALAVGFRGCNQTASKR